MPNKPHGLPTDLTLFPRPCTASLSRCPHEVTEHALFAGPRNKLSKNPSAVSVSSLPGIPPGKNLSIMLSAGEFFGTWQCCPSGHSRGGSLAERGNDCDVWPVQVAWSAVGPLPGWGVGAHGQAPGAAAAAGESELSRARRCWATGSCCAGQGSMAREGKSQLAAVF